jgi:hypothetical protein
MLPGGADTYDYQVHASIGRQTAGDGHDSLVRVRTLAPRTEEPGTRDADARTRTEEGDSYHIDEERETAQQAAPLCG